LPGGLSVRVWSGGADWQQAGVQVAAQAAR
jgi:hypothetical protein